MLLDIDFNLLDDIATSAAPASIAAESAFIASFIAFIAVTNFSRPHR